MKIKLAILEQDKSYLTRMVSTFGARYSENFEMYSFTDPDVALQNLETAKVDVLLANDAFDINVKNLPRRCGFAYLVESGDIEMVKDQRAICKYQKADLIYKAILGVYSEKASTITGFKMGDESTNVIVFSSPSGGVGTSTVAAACAMHFAAQGRKTLYLNLENFGSADAFFHGQGQFSMTDLIFALKSKKTNLHLKLESCVKQDPSGVYYFSETAVALDMMELKTEEVQQLLSELKLAGDYEYIILDMDFSLSKNALEIWRSAKGIVMVGDGSEQSNQKTKRAFQALSIMEQNADAPLTNRCSFVYNRVSSKNGAALGIEGLRELGGAPRYAGATEEQLLGELAAQQMFDRIL